MPIASATDFISVERVRRQLAVPDTYDSEELADIVAASVAWVEQWVGTPILDAKFRVPVMRPGDSARYLESAYFHGPLLPYNAVFVNLDDGQPIVVPVRGVRGAVGIAYWQEGQTLRETPTGTATPSRVSPGSYVLPQAQAVDDALFNNPVVYPPADGWPTDALDNTPLIVTGNAGFNAVADVPPQWKMAALNIASSLFESPQAAGAFVQTAKTQLMQWTNRGGWP